MDEYKDVLQRIVGKFGLVYDGKRYTWDDVFNRPELFQKAGGKSSGRKLTDAQEAQVSKLLEKNPGWTREEIINELGL
jgi:transposase